MTSRRGRRVRGWWLVVVCLLAAASVTLSCTSSEDDAATTPRSGPVELVARLGDLAFWEMSGPLVESGAICPWGYSRGVSVLDRETREWIGIEGFERREAEASSPMQAIDAILVAEYRCADGSGTFVVEEDFTTGEWLVLSGQGAYRTIGGHGSTTLEFDTSGTPRHYLVDLELDLDAGADDAGTIRSR